MPGYSFEHEVSYFFMTGVPLGMAAIFKWGIPGVAAMAFAGHTAPGESAKLQTSLGYARITYNIGVLMVLIGMLQYFFNAVPGALGAGRPDRLPSYLKRSMLFCFCFMVPFWSMQVASNPRPEDSRP